METHVNGRLNFLIQSCWFLMSNLGVWMPSIALLILLSCWEHYSLLKWKYLFVNCLSKSTDGFYGDFIVVYSVGFVCLFYTADSFIQNRLFIGDFVQNRIVKVMRMRTYSFIKVYCYDVCQMFLVNHVSIILYDK